MDVLDFGSNELEFDCEISEIVSITEEKVYDCFMIPVSLREKTINIYITEDPVLLSALGKELQMDTEGLYLLPKCTELLNTRLLDELATKCKIQECSILIEDILKEVESNKFEYNYLCGQLGLASSRRV